MSKQIEALKLALEALECALSDDRPYIVQCKEAITAIKEALMSVPDGAQPAVTKSHKQEPVGYWMGEFNDGGAARLYEVPQESMFGRTYRNIPLYTTPPQRPSRSDIKPLTDEETYKIQTSVGYSGGFSRFVGIVRAIEAAHGIYAPTERKE